MNKRLSTSCLIICVLINLHKVLSTHKLLSSILFFRVSGAPPFQARDEDKLYELIKAGELDYSGKAWEGADGNFYIFL